MMPPSNNHSPRELPDYGYGDATPDVASKYGYGDATPDVASQYGYGDATPDLASKFGYGDASPDVATKYGYGDASPGASKAYGYGDAAPDVQRKNRASPTSESRRPRCIRTNSLDMRPRRSSMKQAGASPPTSRRASMGPEVSYYLPGQDTIVRRRRSITFNEKVKVQPVTSASELTDEPLWIADKEYQRMRRNSMEMVRRMGKPEFKTVKKMIGMKSKTDDDEHCVRGLEKMLPDSKHKDYKILAWYSVFDEQDMQREAGHFDDEYLAASYLRVSQKSVALAHSRAQQDAQDIAPYLRNTRKECRRLSM